MQRWTAYITLIMAAFFGTIGFFLVPETSHAKILQSRAKKIRFQSKNWAIHSQRDTIDVEPKTLINTYLLRPFIMLFREPILLLVTIYMALIYGILYLFFEAYPISFQEERGWNQGVGALPFLGIMIGVILGGLTILFFALNNAN
jgi:DHA1 family multidrug resistance protein-like MFS transporter